MTRLAVWVIAVALATAAGCNMGRPFKPGKHSPAEIEQLKQEAAGLSPMIRVEGGCFTMGENEPPAAAEGDDEEAARLCVTGMDGKTTDCVGVYEDESPEHEVCLDPFEIDQHEVTFAAYQLCAETLTCEPSSLASDTQFWGPNRPATGVNWPAAKNYCEWIGRRLPTEAEWEFAARGTDGRPYPWGAERPTCHRTAMHLENVPDACGRYGTKNVMAYPLDISPFGLYDMGGNVREWVSDRYHPAYYRSLAGGRTWNPIGPQMPLEVVVNELGDGPDAQVITMTEHQHVLRGGTYLMGEIDAAFRTTNRRGLEESPKGLGPMITVGFRCARSVPRADGTVGGPGTTPPGEAAAPRPAATETPAAPAAPAAPATPASTEPPAPPAAGA